MNNSTPSRQRPARRTNGSSLTAAQRKGAADAAAVSASAFRKAQRMVPKGNARVAAFAAQAAQYLASVDALGIDRAHPSVAVTVRQALGNVRAGERLSQSPVAATPASAAA